MNISEYVNKGHRLTKMDPRVKVLLAIAVLVMVLSHRGFAFHGAVSLSALLLCWGMKIPWKVVSLRLLEPLFIILMIILLKFFFSGHEPLFTLPLPGITITGYGDGLLEGLAIGSRIISAILVVSVLVFSTPFTQLMAALSWLRVPKGFIEIASYAYRYIFVLLEDAGVIYSAQKNRLGYSSLRRGFKSFGVLTGSLILKAFDHSQNVTVAMVQRGYDGHFPLLKHKPFRMAEVVFSLLFITAMGIAWKI